MFGIPSRQNGAVVDQQLLALLLVIVVLLVWRATNRDRREYGRFKRMRTTRARQKVMRRWMLESALVFGGLSGAVLLATWQVVPAVLADAQAWTPIAWMRRFITDSALGSGLVVGLVLGVAAALVVPIVLLKRASTDDVPKLGDIEALLPRTRGELPYGAGLAVTAGVFEELMFRLAMPALLYGIWPNALVAFLGASVLFGALHLYQKWVGVLTSTVLGLIFVALYVLSGSIVVPIVLHLVIDARSLVLLPLVVDKVWAKRA